MNHEIVNEAKKIKINCKFNTELFEAALKFET